MKRHIYGIVLLLASCLALFATTAHAQDNNSLRAHIPFAFAIRSTPLPAGNYTIRRTGSQQDVWQIKGADNKRGGVLLIPMNIQGNRTHQTQLVFKRYGAAYFLSQMQTPDYQFVLSESRAEGNLRRIARTPKANTTARIKPEVVTVALVVANK